MPPKKTRFDDLDYLIIRELHTDARISASEIARKTNANQRTIRKRIDRLLSESIIRLTAILDPEAFGYVTAADIFLETERESAILERLVAMPEVTYVALGQKTSEISIQARFKDNEALRQFLGHTLPGIGGVTVSRYTLVPRILRNIDEWIPTKETFSTS